MDQMKTSSLLTLKKIKVYVDVDQRYSVCLALMRPWVSLQHTHDIHTKRKTIGRRSVTVCLNFSHKEVGQQGK